MYERPTLNQLGKVDDVILGIASVGYDLDGYLVVRDFEFEQDADVFEDRLPVVHQTP